MIAASDFDLERSATEPPVESGKAFEGSDSFEETTKEDWVEDIDFC